MKNQMRLAPRLLVPCFVVASVATAQLPDTTRQTTRATVSGVVTDSVSSQPLAGAVVQLVAAQGPARSARIAYSDWLGRFSFNDVPDGRYTIAFFHPLLDSLGVDAPVREVVVEAHAPTRADLATPSPIQVRTAVCGSSRSGVVVGTARAVEDASPLAGAVVTAKWLEFSFTKKGIVPHLARVGTTTAQNGWFRLCNVPAVGTLSLMAAYGNDSTDLVELEIPESGLIHRELYIGPVAPVVTQSPSRPNTQTSPAAHGGGARLSGTVVSAEDGKPVVGAEVSVSRGVRARTNERGEWTLREVPLGTRMLEVRAVGYSPERRPLDVANGAPPVRVALSTLSATLEAVRVSATMRLHMADIAGFHERRRTGGGHYLTAADIERRGDLFTSEIFRSISGLQLGYASDTLPPHDPTLDPAPTVNKLILMRSISGEWCVPGIYLNGVLYPGVSAGDLNSLITIKEVAGIEVYSAASVPSQYQQTMSGCGSVLIWRK